MLDQKTLKKASEECNISMGTAFIWRHKILDTLSELTEKTYLTGVSYAKPGKLGKVSSECIKQLLGQKIARNATLCIDKARAYRDIAVINEMKLIQMDTDCRTTQIDGKTYDIQRVNAYHSRLKTFIRRFHGVSTKHLGNYIVWNDLLSVNRRKTEEFIRQLLGQLFCARITRYGYDITHRPPLPVIA